MTDHEKLRVIAVGGAGAMGRHAVRTIKRLGSASVVAIADIDLTRADTLAREIGDIAISVKLDATDPDAMRSVFGDYDVVLNTMGPFAMFARPIMAAAIDSGCHYLDIGDDWQSTLEAFELDATARERGLHVVIGLGSSPGVTNLLATVAASRLEVVEQLHTGWKVSAAVAEEEPDYPVQGHASAALKHWLLQCSGTIKVWKDGALVDESPVAEVTLDFPGIGHVSAYTMGHPEPVSLARSYPQLRDSLNLQSGPAWLFAHLREVAAEYESGSITLAEGARRLGDLPVPADPGPRDRLPLEWALASGSRNGRRVSVAVYPRSVAPGRMGGNTGIPLGIGVELLRRKRIKDVGVHAPESALVPEDFFEIFATMVTEPCDAAELLHIVESDM